MLVTAARKEVVETTGTAGTARIAGIGEDGEYLETNLAQVSYIW